MPVRIGIVEDDRRYRIGLEAFIEAVDDFELVDSFSTAAACVDHSRERHGRGEPIIWDVVLMDIDTPGGVSGIEAVRTMKELFPQVRPVMITVFEEPKTILEAICAGADGYLLKSTPPDELEIQIRQVMEGGGSLTPQVARSVLELVRRGDRPTRTPIERTPIDLTGRERDVLKRLVKGLAYKEIADDLDVSIDTVRTHIRNLYRKLQVQSAAAAVSRAIREGLV